MTNEFTVVGEDRADNQRLLVLGADGRYYSYHPRRKRLVRVELDERWVLYSTIEHVGSTEHAGSQAAHDWQRTW